MDIIYENLNNLVEEKGIAGVFELDSFIINIDCSETNLTAEQVINNADAKLLSTIWHEYTHFLHLSSTPSGYSYMISRSDFLSDIGDNWQHLKNIPPKFRPSDTTSPSWIEATQEWNDICNRFFEPDCGLTIKGNDNDLAWNLIEDRPIIDIFSPSLVVAIPNNEKYRGYLTTLVFLENAARAVGDLIYQSSDTNIYLTNLHTAEIKNRNHFFKYYGIRLFLQIYLEIPAEMLLKSTIKLCNLCLMEEFPFMAFRQFHRLAMFSKKLARVILLNTLPVRANDIDGLINSASWPEIEEHLTDRATVRPNEQTLPQQPIEVYRKIFQLAHSNFAHAQNGALLRAFDLTQNISEIKTKLFENSKIFGFPIFRTGFGDITLGPIANSMQLSLALYCACGFVLNFILGNETNCWFYCTESGCNHSSKTLASRFCINDPINSPSDEENVKCIVSLATDFILER